MQNNVKKKFEKAKSTCLSLGMDTYILESFLVSYINQTEATLKQLSIYSLQYTTTFQKLWHVIDFFYFRSFYTLMIKQIPAMIPMIGGEAVITKFVLLLIWNFIVKLTILKSSWVLANHLCYLNVNCISSSI